MVIKSRPHHSERTHDDCESYDRLAIAPVEHYVTGGCGLLVAVLGTALVYPWLVPLVEVVPYLSSTLVIFSVAAVWLAVWLTLELVWEWRAGRLSRA